MGGKNYENVSKKQRRLLCSKRRFHANIFVPKIYRNKKRSLYFLPDAYKFSRYSEALVAATAPSPTAVDT